MLQVSTTNSSSSSSSSWTAASPGRQYSPTSIFSSPGTGSTPLRNYFSRKQTSKIRTGDLPYEDGAIGMFSLWGLFYGCIFLSIPLAYLYIVLILLRELCDAFEFIHNLIQHLPMLMRVIETMQKSSRLVEMWCIVEGIFFICLKLQIEWLQYKDPLEASLSAAPMMDTHDRTILWNRMMECEAQDPISFLCGWFLFDTTPASSTSSESNAKMGNKDMDQQPEHPDLVKISRYDVRDFICWSMFEGRNQEHLTGREMEMLDEYLLELEHRISLQLFGAQKEEEETSSNNTNPVDSPAESDDELTLPPSPSRLSEQTTMNSTYSLEELKEEHKGERERAGSQFFPSSSTRAHLLQQTKETMTPKLPNWRSSLPKPARAFRFRGSTNYGTSQTFFSNLYENYKQRYEQYRAMIENSDFHPVQDFCNFMEENAIHPAYQRANNMAESAYHTANSMAENAYLTANSMAENAYNTANSMAENAYNTANTMAESAYHRAEHAYHYVTENAYNSLVVPGSNVDKQLTSLCHATQGQLTVAWNSVKGRIRERLETAEFLASRLKKIRQQLRGYRVLLNRMREMSSSVPSRQMAKIMRKITECNESIDRLETTAMNAFVKATGYAAQKNRSLLQFVMGRASPPPQRYAKYSSDPLLGLATYPLGLHCLILGVTEIPLRVMMHNRGFTRRVCGPVAYYFHPGTASAAPDGDDDDSDASEDKMPIVFVHGIGIGLIAYVSLIDCLLKSGRPILLPEIPYVSGFRPWQSPNSVLSPAVVCSTMTDMLATHGFLQGTFCGHSYGTSWLSYMCKYAPNAIAAVCFLDPICFCLYLPRLTKMFVYHRPDPGTISYLVRTDLMVNWTIQRSFPWSWIILFYEQLANVPCSVFLSDQDMLVPAVKVESYLSSKGAPVVNFNDATRQHFDSSDLTVTVFRGDGHGGWTTRTTDSPLIAECVEVLCNKAEKRQVHQTFES